MEVSRHFSSSPFKTGFSSPQKFTWMFTTGNSLFDPSLPYTQLYSQEAMGLLLWSLLPLHLTDYTQTFSALRCENAAMSDDPILENKSTSAPPQESELY